METLKRRSPWIGSGVPATQRTQDADAAPALDAVPTAAPLPGRPVAGRSTVNEVAVLERIRSGAAGTIDLAALRHRGPAPSRALHHLRTIRPADQHGGVADPAGAAGDASTVGGARTLGAGLRTDLAYVAAVGAAAGATDRCGSCEVPLADRARFCRRCGARRSGEHGARAS